MQFANQRLADPGARTPRDVQTLVVDEDFPSLEFDEAGRAESKIAPPGSNLVAVHV